MKLDLLKFLIGVVCVSFSNGCSGSTSSPSVTDIDNQLTVIDTNYRKVDYVTTILQIDKKCEDSGTWDALFADKEFINVYEHSSYYIDSAILFLADERFTLHQKTVCIYSMQRSKLEDYIRLFERCTDLFNKEKIPELLLSRTISPTFGKRKPIVENYNNAIVKKLLQSIRDGGKASQEFKLMIDKILSGEYWNNIKKFTEETGETN